MAWQWPWAKKSRVTPYGDIGWIQSGSPLSLLPSTKIDYQREAGSVWLSSIVAGYLGWISRTFPEAPPVLMDKGRKDGDEYITDHPVLDLLRNPNGVYNGDHLMNCILLSWWCCSDAYVLKEYDNGTVGPVRLTWIPTDQIRVQFGTSSDRMVEYYEHIPTQARWEPRRMIHFRHGANPGTMGRTGLSPLLSCLREIVTDNRSSNMVAAVLANMGIVGGILSPKGTTGPMNEPKYWEQPERSRLRDSYTQTFTGDAAGNLMVLSTEADYKEVGKSPEDMALDVVRQYPETRVGAAFGISPMVAGFKSGLDRSTFSNYEEARAAAYESNIIPTKSAFGRVLQSQLLEVDYPKSNLEIGWDYRNVRVLQADEDARATRLVSLVSTGILTKNEARLQLGLDPVEGGDELAAPATDPKDQSENGKKPPAKDVGSLIRSVETARQLLGMDETEAHDAWLKVAREDVIPDVEQ